MPADENKAIVRRCWQACFNDGTLAIVDELVAPGYRWHGPGGQEVSGRDGIKQLIGAFRTAFPDIHQAYEDQLVEGDTVASRWTVTGTHQGDLFGIPPTGKPITMPGMVISRFAGDQIAEEWEEFDQLGMMQQLGVIPSPEQVTE